MHVVRLRMRSLNTLNLFYPNSAGHTTPAEQPLSTRKTDRASLRCCVLSTDGDAVISRQNLVGVSIHSSRNICMGLEYIMLQLWVTHDCMEKVVRKQAGYPLTLQLTPGSCVSI